MYKYHDDIATLSNTNKSLNTIHINQGKILQISMHIKYSKLVHHMYGLILLIIVKHQN